MLELLPEKLALTIISGRSLTGATQWEFEPPELIRIGRGDDCDVLLDDGKVSRFHAAISVCGRQWSCGCVGQNGTFVDGRRVEQFVVTDGLIAEFARRGPRLQFQLVASEPTESVEPGQVSMWIVELAEGRDDSAEKLFEECFDRIVRMARSRLSPSLRRMGDEEDIALSVFQSLCMGLDQGKFPDLSSSRNLWRLLTTMTARKVVDWAHQQNRLKRGGGQVRGESVFFDAGRADAVAGFDGFVSDDLAPEVALHLAERVESLLTLLDPELRAVAALKMDGLTNDEIAEQLECNARTVQRRLQAIRAIWSAEIGADFEL